MENNATNKAYDIRSKAYEITLVIRRKTFTKKDKAVSERVAVRNGTNARRAGNFNKRLFAKKHLAKINSIATEIGNYYREKTLPWGIGGSRILPTALFFEFRAWIIKKEAEFYEAVNEFIANYPLAVAEAKAELNGLFNPADYEDPAKLRDSFRIEFEHRPIADTSDFRLALSDIAVERLKNELESDYSKKLDKAMAEIWTRLSESVKDMRDKLDEYSKDHDVNGENASKKFMTAWARNVRNVAKAIPSLNLTDDPRLEELRVEVEELLESNPDDALKTSVDSRKKAIKKADDILGKMGAFA